MHAIGHLTIGWQYPDLMFTDQLIIVSVWPDEPYSPCHGSYILHNLLLHQIEAHCHNGHAQKDVHGAEDDLGPGFSLIQAS